MSPCSALTITWHPQGYQCLGCGTVAEHSWDIKHNKELNPQLWKSMKEGV